MKAGFYLSPAGDRIVYINKVSKHRQVVEGVFTGLHYLNPYSTFILTRKAVKHFYGNWKQIK